MSCEPVTVWPFKGPAEEFPVAFSYARELAEGETITGVIEVSVTVISGTDGNPSAIKGSEPQIDGSKVRMFVRGGVPGATYALVCDVSTSTGKKLSRPAILPVEVPERWNQYRRVINPTTT